MCVRADQESREAVCSWRSVSRVWTASVLPRPPHPKFTPTALCLPYLPATTSPPQPTRIHSRQMILHKWRSNDLFWGRRSKVADSVSVTSAVTLKLKQSYLSDSRVNTFYRYAVGYLGLILPARASGFILSSDPTIEFVPPTTYSSAVQCLQPSAAVISCRISDRRPT